MTRLPETSARHLEAREAIGWLALVGLVFVGGYYGVAELVPGASARDLSTPLDALIPFHPGWLLVYVAVYPAATLPLFVVRDAPLLRRIALAYLGVIALCLVCFSIWPVSGAPLRDSVGSLDPDRLLEWGTLLLYRLDPPRNLFPSLHIALATLAVCGAGRAQPVVGRVGAIALVFIVCSVVGIRQHYAVDALVGGLLALASAAAALRPWRPDPSHPPARPPRSALGCLALYVLGVSSFGLAFLLGR